MKKAIVSVGILFALAACWAQGAAHYSLPYDVSILKAQVAEDALQPQASSVAPAAAPTQVIPYWVDLVNAEALASGGTGVYVAVLDTGLLPQWTNYFPEAQIATQWGKGFSHEIYWDPTVEEFMLGPLRDDRGFLTDPYLGSGHGTHVSSTVIGFNFKTATADMKVRGVAPMATIIPVLVLDAWEIITPDGKTNQFTGGFDDMISSGIRYVADLAVAQKIKVIINMSLGGPDPAPEIREAIDYAISKGLIVVASAGNDGLAGMGYPGAYPEVISAAAGGWTMQWITLPPPAPTRWWLNNVPEKLNTKDLLKNNWQTYLTDFSSRPVRALGQAATDLDVCAPGAAIVGPFKNYFSTNTAYYYVYGTSMAAPHVSSIAAILKQYSPGLHQAAMETALKKGSTGLPLSADGATILDPTISEDLVFLKWNGIDYGAGWLTVDGAFKALARP